MSKIRGVVVVWIVTLTLYISSCLCGFDDSDIPENAFYLQNPQSRLVMSAPSHVNSAKLIVEIMKGPSGDPRSQLWTYDQKTRTITQVGHRGEVHMSVDIYGGAKNSKGLLTIFPTHGNDNQQWVFVKANGMQPGEIRCPGAHNRAITISPPLFIGKKLGSQLKMESSKGGNHPDQMWVMVPYKHIPKDAFFIATIMGDGVLEARDMSDADGTEIVLYHHRKIDIESQLWTYDKERKVIVGVKSGKAIDIKGGTENAELILWEIHGNPNQQWSIRDDGYIQCIPGHGKVFTVLNNKLSDYTPIRAMLPSTNPNANLGQFFHLVNFPANDKDFTSRTPPLPSLPASLPPPPSPPVDPRLGSFFIESELGGLITFTGSDNGKPIILKPFDSSNPDHQLFKFNPDTSTISPYLDPHKAIDVAGGDKLLQVWDKVPNANQRIKWDPTTMEILVPDLNKVYTVANDVPMDGEQLLGVPNMGKVTQKWKKIEWPEKTFKPFPSPIKAPEPSAPPTVTPAPPIPPSAAPPAPAPLDPKIGSFFIVSTLGKGVLTCTGTQIGSKVLIRPPDLSHPELQLFKDNKSDTTIENIQSGHVLDILGFNVELGIWEHKGYANQKWKWDETGTKELVSEDHGKVIGIHGDVLVDNAPIEATTVGGKKTQKWKRIYWPPGPNAFDPLEEKAPPPTYTMAPTPPPAPEPSSLPHPKHAPLGGCPPGYVPAPSPIQGPNGAINPFVSPFLPLLIHPASASGSINPNDIFGTNPTLNNAECGCN